MTTSNMFKRLKQSPHKAFRGEEKVDDSFPDTSQNLRLQWKSRLNLETTQVFVSVHFESFASISSSCKTAPGYLQHNKTIDGKFC